MKPVCKASLYDGSSLKIALYPRLILQLEVLPTLSVMGAPIGMVSDCSALALSESWI